MAFARSTQSRDWSVSSTTQHEPCASASSTAQARVAGKALTQICSAARTVLLGQVDPVLQDR